MEEFLNVMDKLIILTITVKGHVTYWIFRNASYQQRICQSSPIFNSLKNKSDFSSFTGQHDKLDPRRFFQR